jgi:hypothetical protein
MRYMKARNWATAVVTFAVVVGTAGVASADEASDASGAGVALAQLADLSSVPEQNVLDGAVNVSAAPADSENGYVEVDGAVAMIPITSDDPIILGADSENPFEVTVVQEDGSAVQAEEVADGVVGYDAGDGSVTVAVPKEDGSVQLAVVIGSPDAPAEYEFAVGDGHDIRQYPDGSIGVFTADGEFVGGIDAPWATDANGSAVPTRFEVRGSSVFQVVDHQGAGFAYPIVADPWLGKALISKTVWDGAILRVYPTDWAVCKHWYSICAGYGARWAAWDEVQAKTPGTRENTSSMRDQLYCHFDVVRLVAPNKVSWNLDEVRPAVNYASMLANRCNP